MKAFKNYPIEISGGIPINVGITKGIFPGTAILHNHSAIEINLIMEGTTDYLIGGSLYSCRKGDVVLIGEEEVHRAWNADTAVFLVLQFKREILVGDDAEGYEQKMMAPFRGLGKEFPHVFKADMPLYDELVDTLILMEAEGRKRQTSYRLVQKALVQLFAAKLGRAFDIPDNSPLLGKGSKVKRMAPIIRYVEENYSECIQVTDLASLVNMSPANFTRSFRSAMGKSPMEYVIQQRIRHASTMLQNSDRKIIDIANDCGFPSISHFIASFKKYTGQPPHEYRKEQQR